MEKCYIKKSDFIALVIGVIGGLLFSIGMCMCLLPEWNAFNEGVIAAAAGGVLLLVLVIIRSDPDDFHTQPAGNAGKK